MKAKKDGSQTQNPARPQVGRVATRRRSKPICDVASFNLSFQIGVYSLLEGHPCRKSLLGIFSRLSNNVRVTEDVLSFIDACALIRSELVQIGSWNTALSKELKHRWVRGIRSAVETAFEPSLIVHPSTTFDRVTTFLGWLKRLPVCIRPEEQAVDAYLECDRRISSINFDENVYVPMLRRIWFEWLEDFELQEPFLPRHGPGSTADAGQTPARKWQMLGSDHAVGICLKSRSLQRLVELPNRPFKRMSKVKFVPKQAGKDRTICAEPATLQYLQQGVFEQLSRYMARNRSISAYIHLSLQQRNRELCARAQVEGLATLDLSDASDSVSWRLIKALTRGMPFYRYLLGTRSTHTLLDGRVYDMDKFAPMGSALCFPVEAILFASAVELAYRLHYGQASHGHRSGCAVYGDDIICPAAIADRVIGILSSLGFVVNTGKSYLSGYYYESCGVEYLHSVRINTIRHPRAHLLCQGDATPELLGTVTELANTLLAFGSYDARRFLLKYFENKRVRVGSKSARFVDMLWFGEGGVIPFTEPYREGKWYQQWYSRTLQQPTYVVRREVSDYDYIDYSHRAYLKSHQKPPHREIDGKFSRRAINCLLRFGFPEILSGDDVEMFSQHTAGRLRHRLRMVRRTVW